MPGEPFLLCSRRPVKGTVALADALGVAVASLWIGPEGVRVDRFVDVGDAALPADYASADPAAVAGALAAVLDEHGFPRRLASLGLDDSLTGASLTDLPEARGRALRALLARHVRGELPVQTAPVVADLARLPPGQGADPDTPGRSWVAWCDEQLVQGLAGELRARGVRVDRLVPPSVALLDMVGRARLGEHERLELCVRFCWPSVVIGVFVGGRPEYARFLGELLVDAADPVDAGVLELHRTVAFIRERNRGRSPDLIWYTGLDPSRSHDLEQRLEQDLGVGVAALRLVTEGAGEAGRSDRLAVLTALLFQGSDSRRRRQQVLDLLPAPPPRDQWVLAGLGSLLLATAAVSVGLFEQAQAGNLDVAARRSELLASRSRLLGAADERAARAAELGRHEAWAASLALIPGCSSDPVQPLLESTLALPEGVRLGAARLSQPYAGAGSVQLELSGDFTGREARALSDYLAWIRAQPWAGALHNERGKLTFDRTTQRPVEELALEISLP